MGITAPAWRCRKPLFLVALPALFLNLWVRSEAGHGCVRTNWWQAPNREGRVLHTQLLLGEVEPRLLSDREICKPSYVCNRLDKMPTPADTQGSVLCNAAENTAQCTHQVAALWPKLTLTKEIWICKGKKALLSKPYLHSYPPQCARTAARPVASRSQSAVACCDPSPS